MSTLKAMLPVLLACIHHAQIADAFSRSYAIHPPLKGSSSHTSKDASAFTKLRISNAERTTDTIQTNEPTTKSQKKPARKSDKKPQHASKRRAAQFSNLKAFNSKLTKCNSASELLGCFADQASSKGGLARRDETDSAPVASAATRLAGAGKVNSVNFSTCLHRLARFASEADRRGEGGDGERRLALSDPRFALLLCSVAEMGARADASLTVMEGKEVVEQWERDSMMDIDEGMKAADDVLSGIVGVSLGAGTGSGSGSGAGGLDGRKSSSSGGMDETDRKKELAEATMNHLLGPNKRSTFSSRECSNICWALAKMKIAPPSDALPLGRVDANGARSNAVEDERKFSSLDEMSLDVLSSSFKIRTQLFEEARKRKTGASAGGSGSWIPELARLAGKVMDLFAVQIIDDYASRRSKSETYDNPRAKGYQSRRTFNPQEMASCLWAFAKSQRADERLFSAVGEELIRQMELMSKEDGVKPKPQEFSNTIWGFATAGVRGEAQVKLEKLMADAMDEGDGQFFGAHFKPQELANTAWALATLHSKRTQNEDNSVDRLSPVSGLDAIEDDAVVRILRWVAKNIQQQVHLYKPQELSNTVWASATIGFGYDEASGTNVHNDYVHVTSDNAEQDKAMVYDTLETIAENAVSRLEKFKAQELNNLAWGYARLGHRTEKADRLFQGIADELTRRVHQFKPQDVGTTLWSLATVECQCPDAFRTGASRLNFQKIRLFKPQEMSNAVWALATAGFVPKYTHVFDTTLVPEMKRPTMADIQKDPITECFAAVGGELMRRPQDFKDQELKDVLWAFSRSGIRHPSLFKRIAEHIVGPRGRTFSTFSSQGIGNTVWSFARQGQLALDVIDSLGMANVRVGTTGRLAVYETSCLDVGEDLIRLLFARAAEAGMNTGLDRFRTQDLSNTCWAYSTLGLLHSGFFKQVEKQIMKRLKNRLSGQEIANILWAFATLNAQPDPAMVDALSSHIYRLCSDEKTGKPTESSISSLFKRQEIANVAWSCAVLGRYPKDLMNTLYQGMFGTDHDPQYMKKIFGDAGLQKSSVMTMYYVQYAADVEAPELKLSLPKGFPNGWIALQGLNLSSNGNEGDLAQTSSSMLQLTVSKLQREVSKSMAKIGFDNVLEYVIDAPTNQDIDDKATLPENPEEFLSVDIANVEQRLGVEVDGPGHFVRLIDAGDASYTRDSMLQWSADRGENRVNGPTLLKHRLLSALGWDIIHIPYWEYQNLSNDEDKEAYCKSLLSNYSSVR